MTDTSSQSPNPTNPTPSIPNTQACVRCRKRKVRCDRKHPCNNCASHKAECEYQDPLPRRRKRNLPESEDGTILSRLRLYEDALRKAGIEPSSIDGRESAHGIASAGIATTSAKTIEPKVGQTSTPEKSESSRLGQGRLIAKGGRSIYLDNNFWRTVSNELQDDECILPENSAGVPEQRHVGSEAGTLDEGALLFGSASKYSLASAHPNPVHVFKLWQVFLENVNPLTKIIHAPTMQQRILSASGDLSSVPEDLEALMFAIYCAALTSLSDNEVLQTFAETRSKLLAVYRDGAQKALVNARFLRTSSMVVLQALVIFILSSRTVYDPHTLWSLSGIGMRIAQRIGLHRDGSNLGLSIFETEMRRRLWWQLMVADAVIGHKSGSVSLLGPAVDTRTPSNVNDSDLDPDMKENPVESTRATEMVFCLMRYELGKWLDHHSKSKSETHCGPWGPISSTSIPIQEKDQIIQELEATLENKFIRFCDPSIPLHLMTIMVARSIGPTLRLSAHHPRLYYERGERPTQSEKNLLFDICISVAEYNNMLLTTSKTRRYLWHIDYHFPWDIVLYMLSELRHRTMGDQAANAWHLIDITCARQYQELATKAKSPLHLAIATLGVKAWAAHVAECERHRLPTLPQPNIISIFWRLTQQSRSETAQMTPLSMPLEARTRATAPMSAGVNSYPQQACDTFSEGIPIDPNADFSALAEMCSPDESPIDWDQWDELLQQYQESSGVNMFGAPG
ncbi:Transcription factor [Aspergillus sclerotialis]|uniref:Transcription factor n=1 Tax=Aspergillus sclerotialis TaxID=2070753 RepID=A0A3A2ZUA6_9EURO|nr:Transcription factor [Aspergillus sclerotialis]